MRVAMRNGTDPNTKRNWLGFRCARDVQAAPRPVSQGVGKTTR
jgi:iron(II)-dependent oxidoreductase